MELHIKRVKCGDCAVLCGEKRQLIFDCGSDNQDAGRGLSTRAFAYSAIRDYIDNQNPTDILISHLHSDHYIISNGGYQNRKVGNRFIEALAKVEDCQLCCTDAHTDVQKFCGYARAHGSCAHNCWPVTGDEWTALL